MKKLFFCLLPLIFWAGVATGAEGEVAFSGPTPPPGVGAPSLAKFSAKEWSGAVLEVQPMLWRHGCTPTALGMIFAYWAEVIPELFPREDNALLEAVASEGHIMDYAEPMEGPDDPIFPDNSELLDAEDRHSDDSVADFVRTSRSIDGSRYGWTWTKFVKGGMEEFTAYKTGRIPSVSFSSPFKWEELKKEIIHCRPVLFLVDSDTDGIPDHSVTVIGYRENGGRHQYACLDTWFEEPRWVDFSEVREGQSFGVYGGWTYDPGVHPPRKIKFFPAPSSPLATGKDPLVGVKYLLLRGR